MTRSGRWTAAVIAALLVGPAGPTARGAEKALSVEQIMERLTERHNAAEKALLKDGAAPPLDDLREMDRLYGFLAEAYQPYYGADAQGWRVYCDDSRAAVGATVSALSAGDTAAARSAFLTLAVLREEAHKQFQPGLLKRLSHFFTKKHPKEKVQ
jgi:hypothetical protein